MEALQGVSGTFCRCPERSFKAGFVVSLKTKNRKGKNPK